MVDPLDEGKIKARFKNSCDALPGDVKCRCRNPFTVSKSSAICEMTWTPSEHGNFNAEIEATNTVNDGSGINKRKKTENKTLILKVKKAPVVETPVDPEDPEDPADPADPGEGGEA